MHFFNRKYIGLVCNTRCFYRLSIYLAAVFYTFSRSQERDLFVIKAVIETLVAHVDYDKTENFTESLWISERKLNLLL